MVYIPGSLDARVFLQGTGIMNSPSGTGVPTTSKPRYHYGPLAHISPDLSDFSQFNVLRVLVIAPPRDRSTGMVLLERRCQLIGK